VREFFVEEMRDRKRKDTQGHIQPPIARIKPFLSGDFKINA
jgi:hypothetical protein